MNANLRIGTILLVAGGLAACTSQEATPTPGNGGTSGGAGTSGGGTTGTGGGGGMYAVSDGVMCLPTMVALITDFTYNAEAGNTTNVHFGDNTTTLSGAQFVYPTDGTWPIVSDVTGNNWHISGTLGTYSGFGISFDNCSRVNAMAYSGISFSISGSVAMGNMVTMGMGTLNNVIAASWLSTHGGTPTAGAPGRCVPTSGTNQYDQPTCGDATRAVPVTATPTVQNITWSMFTGGKPEANVTPSDITSIYWFFPPPAGAGGTTPTTYAADIRIDDLKWLP